MIFGGTPGSSNNIEEDVDMMALHSHVKISSSRSEQVSDASDLQL